MAQVNPEILDVVDRILAITHAPDYPKTIQARYVKPGIYLLSGVFNKVEVLRVNSFGDPKDCGSVSAILEPSPFSTTIAGGTALIPFSEEYHKLYKPRIKEKAEKLLSAKERKLHSKREEFVSKIKEERASKIPRSGIIDVELSKVTSGKTPDWNKIADAVIKGGAAEEDARKSIINQSKQRHKWYTIEGKDNPALKLAV